MNKHTAILGVLGLTVLETHSGIMSTKAHVRMTEEDLDKIEAHLEANDVSGLNTQITNLTTTVSENTASLGSINSAIASAFETNGLELPEGTSAADAIATLSTKCKEYGEKTNTHSFIKNDGKDNETLLEGYMDPNAEHNQLLTKLFS
ncbi:hypothetical protein AB670_02542 [Chryseobacterium sp. MOF25P]|uniref:hypothetical protein n=1 Tax=unclassified Chryseobacterium TaxID=2593645 RepID=UPI000805D850|nr:MULTISPECIES: hypothetical protein [unclassified Chryseobacterium]MBO6183076.1 hypothetical protein [Chryseobacterium sp.]OBW41091.1 hypothetical protein AB670_02542 [Chryseobacterium sp. MOF25P]OBW45779.1 hypothetical protein AB671_02187 [Chryseobacterium sp. BGARF1]